MILIMRDSKKMKFNKDNHNTCFYAHNLPPLKQGHDVRLQIHALAVTQIFKHKKSKQNNGSMSKTHRSQHRKALKAKAEAIYAAK